VCNNNEQLTSSKRNQTKQKNGLGCWKMFYFQTKRQNNYFSQKKILSSRFYLSIFLNKIKMAPFLVDSVTLSGDYQQQLRRPGMSSWPVYTLIAQITRIIL
jgi:hypothetical protein